MYEDYQAPRYNDEQSQGDSGMFGKILRGASNVADLPGSMVRDAMSFSNPFDQLMSPFSSENRTTGAQMSRAMFGGDENSGGNQLAGMIVDILTDPLMIASGGSLAAGKMGLQGAKAGLKGIKGVGQSAKGAYSASKAGSRSAQATSKAARSAQRSYDQADNLSRSSNNLRAQLEGRPMSADMGPMPQGNPNLAYGPEYSWNPDFIGPPSGRVSREALIANRPPEVANAATFVQAFNQFADAARNSGAMRQARVQSLAANPMLRARETAEALGSGAMQGASDFGRLMYGGVRDAVGTGASAVRNNLGGIMRGDRNAMMQFGAVAPNMARTAMGERQSQEPSIDELIAQLMMMEEDPSMMEAY